MAKKLILTGDVNLMKVTDPAVPFRHVAAVLGAADVVFVYMANRLFRTQHPQPVIAGGEGSGIDPRMMFAVLVNFIAFAALASLVIWVRYRLERLRQQVEEAHALKAIALPHSSTHPARSTR